MNADPRLTNVEGSRERRIHVVQGEFHVTKDPDVMLTTILGSCVAACLRDRVLGVGGMNHFLLPGGEKRNASDDGMRYGVHAMELLVNNLLKLGAKRDRLEAKLFGGGRMLQGLTDVGEMNACFAEEFLRREGIALSGSSLRGDGGRRVQFWPFSGRARQIAIGHEAQKVFEAERQPLPTLPETGGLELF